jgi:hypothetical protein
MGDVPPTAVVSAITNTMNAGGYKTWKAAYSNLGTNGAPGSITTVQLAVNFQTLTGTFIPGWTGSLPISQTIRMRHE